MKTAFAATMLLALFLMAPHPATPQVGISIQIGLPPPVAFTEPPIVVVIPDTYYVYAVPDFEFDLFFWNGWWWRPWSGRWYRSRYYDRGWVSYPRVPRFYYDVDPRWRTHYRDRQWRGNPWYYERIEHERLRRNWQRWKSDRHWEKQEAWGVRGYRPPPRQHRQELRQQRQMEYRQRPEVQEYERQRRELQQRSRSQQPRKQPPARIEQPQRRGPPAVERQRPPQPRVGQQRPPGPRERPEGR